MNGVPPTVSQEAVKKAFKCFTGSTADGEVYNFGGGVFFTNHNFYFYTFRDYLEVRRGFDGIVVPKSLGGPASILLRILGEPQLRSGKDMSLYDEPYGCLRVDVAGGDVDQLAAHYQSCKEVLAWLPKAR